MISKPKRTQAQTAEIRRKILAFIGTGPKSMAEIAQYLKVGGRSAEKLIEPLRNKQLILSVRVPGRRIVWALMSDAAKIEAERAELLEQRRLRDLELGKERKRRYREERKAKEDDAYFAEHGEIDDAPVTRKYVRAADVKVEKLGPASVWELACHL